MAKLDDVLEEIKSMGSESTKKVLIRHGAREPFYGTKIEDLKKVLKKIKNDQDLAMQLYDTGISDAMYLAGLMADGGKMSRQQLQHWAEGAYWSMLNEYAVPWVASEHPDGWQIALEWIDSDNERLVIAGWSTLSNWLSVTPDAQLDLAVIKALLQRAEREIHTAPNRVKLAMNSFVICTGGYVLPLTDLAKQTAKNIGKVTADMGDTACKIPLATDYIKKMEDKGVIGKKKKTAKC